MGVFSNKIDRKQLKPGDHIYSWRQAYIIAHHETETRTMLGGFYLSSPHHASRDTPCPKCGYQTKTEAKARGGTCTIASSDSTEAILRRAFFLLKKGFGGYHLFKNNCEDFAMYCKTGLLLVRTSIMSVGQSGQATSLLAAAGAIVSSSLVFMITSLCGLALVGCAMYCVSRYVSDIGVRCDVTKVSVKKVPMVVKEDWIDRKQLKPGDHIYSLRQAYIYAHHGHLFSPLVLKMGVLSNKIEMEQLKPGDHIYSWRQAYIFAHHGTYVGEGMVIHFSRGEGKESGTGTILDRLLISSSPLHANFDIPCPRCEYGATASSDPTEYFLHRSLFLLENEFGGCHVFMNNCEDFAIYCKTSLLVVTNICVGQSGQAASCLAAASAVVSLLLRFMTASFGGFALVGCGILYVSDIGVRCDVAKVPVEKISEMAKED
ncbi:hypothetical protein GmHk_11G032997 [Glycine max]|nr:hypothetical protein GmHk_11G032997 [Glycine max]